MRDRRTAQVFLVLALAACARAPLPPPTVAVPPSPPVDSARTSRVPTIRLGTDSSQYRITSTTYAVEVAERGRSDSTFRESNVMVALTSSPTIGWIVQLSGAHVIPDSLLPPANRRLPADQLERLALQVDPAAAHIGPFFGQVPLCGGSPALLSPLLARLLIMPTRLSERDTGEQRDSLTYTTCAGSAVLTTTLQIVFTAPTDSGVIANISGTVRADSTKALPMRLSGALSGRARIEPSTNAVLPVAVALNLALDLTAQSSVRQQQLKQNTKVTLTRR